MATDLQMSSSTDQVDFPYRALSRSAIVSFILFTVALLGLIAPFEALLALAVIGIIFSALAIRSIRRYPNEFGGLGLAQFSLVANGLLLAGGIAMHSYIYLTEVPPGHVRVPFYALKFDSDPDRPTQTAMEIDGKDVFIKGYIHPSSGGGMLRQFVLVGDLGTCCFGGQPKSSEMIEVTLMAGKTVKGGMTRRKLAGKFSLNKMPQDKTDFDNAVFYRLKGNNVK